MVHPPESRDSIYRTQALQHRKHAWLGRSLLSKQAKGLSAAAISALTMLALAGVLVFGQYSERVSASGAVVLSPPAIMLSAPADGVVEAAFVAEGRFVKKGTPIFAVGTATQIAKGSFTQESRKLLNNHRATLLEEARQVRLRVTRAHALLKNKFETNERTGQRLQALAKRAEAHLGWLSAKLVKYEKLRKEGTALEPELIERVKDLFLAYESLATAELKALEIEREYLDVKEQSLALEKEEKARLDALSNQIFVLDQRILEVDKAEALLVLAPTDGTLASVTAHPGSRVARSQNLAVLIPAGAVAKIEVFTPSDSVGKIASGHAAKVRVAAFPYMQYGKIAGIVESISATPVNLRASAVESDKPSFYRVTLALDPAQKRLENMPLDAGMDVQADIFLRTARLYEWVFKTAGNLLI